MRELTALEFLNIRNKVSNKCGIDCMNCPFSYYNNGYDIDCRKLDIMYPEKSVEIALRYKNKEEK